MASNETVQVNTSKAKVPVDLVDKVRILIRTLESDLDACDFKWTLFVAAATSFRYDSLLKPFPNAYVAKDIDDLRASISQIPAMSVLLEHLKTFYDESAPPMPIDACINDENIDLLYWCLINDKEPTLRSIYRSEVSTIFTFILTKIKPFAEPNKMNTKN